MIKIVSFNKETVKVFAEMEDKIVYLGNTTRTEEEFETPDGKSSVTTIVTTMKSLFNFNKDLQPEDIEEISQALDENKVLVSIARKGVKEKLSSTLKIISKKSAMLWHPIEV